MPKKLPPALSLAALLVVYCLSATDGQGQWPIDWKSEAATTLRLNPAEVEKLAREKVLVSRYEVEQSFVAYTQSGIPPFVTSDAVLNGYHVLFGESMRAWEEYSAMEMAVHLPAVWKLITTTQPGEGLKGDETLIQAAWTRARFVIGVAHRLMGGELEGVPPALRTIIVDEASRIEAGEGRAKPALLGPPDPDFTAFDYTEFKPRGLYESSTELQRYFRATRWLERVPFRSEFREEYLAYYLLGVMYPAKTKADEAASRWIIRRADFCAKLFGSSSSWELAQFSEGRDAGHPGLLIDVFSKANPQVVVIDDAFFKRKSEGLVFRASMMEEKNVPWCEDRDRAAGLPRSKAVEFRIFWPHFRPEDAAFQDLYQVPGQERSGGLELSAWLGVDWARQRIGAPILSVLDQQGPGAIKIYGDDFPEASVWWRQGAFAPVAMKLRGAWHGLTELDVRVPEFMRSTLWQKKTLNTIAASWVQDCHAWTMSVKPQVITPLYRGTARGLVEPVPEFYLRMSWIAKWMAEQIAEVEICRDPVPAQIRKTQKMAEDLRAKTRLDLTEAEKSHVLSLAAEVVAKFNFNRAAPTEEPPTVARMLAAADELDNLARELAMEAKPGSPLWRQVLESTLRLEPRWKDLEVLCLRLSMIAGKQLAGDVLTLEESNIIMSFGLTLSRIMLQDAATRRFPADDDSPGIVHVSAIPPRSTVFHVATGRPRLLYVLYPWQGEELFCQGAILPYHEMDSERPMDDQEWRKLWPQAEGNRPQAAACLDGFIPSGDVALKEPNYP